MDMSIVAMVFFVAGELSLVNGRAGFDEFVKVVVDVLNFRLKMTKKDPKNCISSILNPYCRYCFHLFVFYGLLLVVVSGR